MSRKYDLVCFDLDGTLIADENGDLLWERILRKVYGHNKFNKERYALYRQDKITFMQWVDLDLADWKKGGITKDILIKDIKENLKLNKGAKELVLELKKRGYKIGIISGSVDILLETLFKDHPFDDVFINKIFFDENRLITHWYTSPYGNKRKNVALKIIADKENISMDRTVFVGDHINDISAAKAAGLSIAYNSKVKELDEISDISIKGDMMQILEVIDK